MSIAPPIPRLRLGPDSAGLPLTPEEFDSADYERGWRYELIQGVLIVSPTPLKMERDPNEELGRLLRNYEADHPRGSSLDATLAEEMVYFPEHRRRPDRVIWAGLGRLPKKKEVPTIVVEFVSKGRANRRRDYEVKRAEYGDLGSQEYWIFDRFQRSLTAIRYGADGDESWVYGEEETFTTPRLPGFELPLARLFALADRWGDDEAD